MPEKVRKNDMRIAVTYENGEVFQHFGHTEQFKLYDVEGTEIKSAFVMSTGGSGHGALAGFLQQVKADAIICGGMGGGAQKALKDAGIAIYAGVTGSTDDAVAALLSGTLEYTSDANCSHHHDHDHGDHDCNHHEDDCSCHCH